MGIDSLLVCQPGSVCQFGSPKADTNAGLRQAQDLLRDLTAKQVKREEAGRDGTRPRVRVKSDACERRVRKGDWAGRSSDHSTG